jgi:hypothetical protein
MAESAVKTGQRSRAPGFVSLTVRKAMVAARPRKSALGEFLATLAQ